MISPIYIEFLKGLLVLLFVYSNRYTFAWLGDKASQGGDSFLVVAGICVFALVCFSAMIASAGAKISRAAVALLLLALTGALINRLTIDFQQFYVSFLVLGAYGFAGASYYAPLFWKRLLGLVLLCAAGLPFYLEFSSGLGFGVRLITADIVERVLRIVGFAAVSSHDVILMENAILHVDIPCSGLKGIWLGHVFFIGMVVLFRVSVNVRLLLPYFAFLTCLLVTNTLRVLVLTFLHAVLKEPEFADAVHVPLGVMGFVASCVLGGWMLQFARTQDNQDHQARHLRAITLAPAFVLAVFLAIMFSQFQTTDVASSLVRTQKLAALPEGLLAQPVSLTSGEAAYFGGDTRTIAGKWTINSGGNKGSLLMVSSGEFNRFHAPEICMAANGITVDFMKTVNIPGGANVRFMSLEKGRFTGIYWLQSGSLTTDSFTDRFWKYIFGGRRQWNMVVLILDIPYGQSTSQQQKIITEIFQTLKVGKA